MCRPPGGYKFTLQNLWGVGRMCRASKLSPGLKGVVWKHRLLDIFRKSRHFVRENRASPPRTLPQQSPSEMLPTIPLYSEPPCRVPGVSTIHTSILLLMLLKTDT